MLDHHVDGYLQNGISIDDNAIVFDVGAFLDTSATPRLFGHLVRGGDGSDDGGRISRPSADLVGIPPL